MPSIAPATVRTAFALCASAAAASAVLVLLAQRLWPRKAEFPELDATEGEDQQQQQQHHHSPVHPHLGTPTRPGASSARARLAAVPDSARPHGGAAIVRMGRADSSEAIPLAHKAPVIMGVAGASGSGKTSIASLVSSRLDGLRVVSISADNYYKGLDPGTDAAHYNWDHPSAVDMALLAEHLAALGRGEDVRVPHYDFSRHARVTPVEASGNSTFISARHTDAIICEGLFILADASVRDACDVTIGCVEDLDICLARRLRRDIAERGRTVDSVLAQYVRFVKPGFHMHIAPSLNLADVLIPRARDNVVAIDMLAKELARRIAVAEEAVSQGGGGSAHLERVLPP